MCLCLVLSAVMMVTVMDRLNLPPAFSLLLAVTHSFPPWLPASSPRSREWPSNMCTPAFLLSSIFSLSLSEPAHTYFPNFFLLLKGSGGKREGGREGAKIGRKPLEENEFDRFVQFWIPVFLFPKSVRKPKALPPRWIKSLRPLSEKRGDTHHFLSKYQRKIHTGRTKTQIIISKLLAGNQINAWGFKSGWANAEEKKK